MKFAFVLLFGLASMLLPAGSAAHAEEALFKVHAKDGGPVLEVTPAELAKMKMHRYKAVLPGGTGQVQDVSGPLLRDVFAAAGVSGTKITARALDGYELDIPMEDVQNFDVVAAIEVDGKPLSVRDRGPAWIVYPTVDHPELKDALYEARSVWQLKELIVE